MATPMQFLPGARPTVPSARPSTPRLDEVFLQTIMLFARLPFRRAGETGKGLVVDEGLTSATFRAAVIDWCRSESQRAHFDTDELCGLEVAMHDFSDAELRELVEGAFALYGVK